MLAIWLSHCVQVAPGVPSASPVEVVLQKEGLVNASHENLGLACHLISKFRKSSLLVGGRGAEVMRHRSQSAKGIRFNMRIFILSY